MRLPNFSGSMSIEAARSVFPVGAPVRYFPVADCPSFIRATIRSEPWLLGHGATVVKITGRAGGVLVNHLMRDIP